MYVLRDGTVVEQGYRQDLELPPVRPVFTGPDGEPLEIDGADDLEVEDGEFRKMMRVQGESGGFPIKEEPDVPEVQVEMILDDDDEEEGEKEEGGDTLSMVLRIWTRRESMVLFSSLPNC